MQDRNTGGMAGIPAGVAQRIEEMAKKLGEEVPVFRLGEEIMLRGGRFRVAAIGSKYIRLEGLPGTHVQEKEGE